MSDGEDGIGTSSRSLDCRSFWKAGAVELSSSPARELHAIAELLDNSVDEISNGATYVKMDKNINSKDNSPMLVFQDGNGFKISTMRLGADAVVFTRAIRGSNVTLSVGLLSYTFLRRTLKDDVFTPVLHFQDQGGSIVPLLHGSQGDWDITLKLILDWSPFSSKEQLIHQFEAIQTHGTKVVIYNLWKNDDGFLELDFDNDDEPFWKVLEEGCSVTGVLEANFLETAHIKQDFERTPQFINLEKKLRQVIIDYWKEKRTLIGYQPSGPELRSQHKAGLKDSAGPGPKHQKKSFIDQKTGGYSSNSLAETHDDDAVVIEGYLCFGEFRAKIVLPIEKGKYANSSEKSKNRYLKALARFRKLIVPFLLRRNKSVLIESGDLPCKKNDLVIWLKLTPVQVQLHKNLYKLYGPKKIRGKDDKVIPFALSKLCQLISIDPCLLLKIRDTQTNEDVDRLTKEMAIKLLSYTALDEAVYKNVDNSCKMSFIMDLIENMLNEDKKQSSKDKGLDGNKVEKLKILVYSRYRGVLDLLEAGLLSGNGGSTIIRITRESCARIDIQGARQDSCRLVRVTGTPKETEKARRLIMDIMNMVDHRCTKDARAAAQKVYVPVPREMVGCIIGSSGKRITNIENQPGARVQMEVMQTQTVDAWR
ncbi:hypothetical protein ACQ4PT_043167 [Festuca glaucescens]